MGKKSIALKAPTSAFNMVRVEHKGARRKTKKLTFISNEPPLPSPQRSPSKSPHKRPRVDDDWQAGEHYLSAEFLATCERFPGIEAPIFGKKVTFPNNNLYYLALIIR